MVMKLPFDPKVIRGRNIVIAVINADQKGEQIIQFDRETDDYMKTVFLADISDITVASTTQAMATTKVFGVNERPNQNANMQVNFPLSGMYASAKKSLNDESL